MASVRPRFQVDARPELINHAKILALGKGLSLTEYVLQSLAKNGDDKMKALVDQELKTPTRRKPKP
mgnify:CR=1 FL=1